MAKHDSTPTVPRMGRDARGKFLDAAGHNHRWTKHSTECPHFLRRAAKRELAVYLLGMRKIRMRLTPAEGQQGVPARVRGLQERQELRVRTRIEVLHQLVDEVHLEHRLIRSKDYASLVAKIGERTGEPMDIATLYREPYRSVLAGQALNWKTEEDRALRKLMRETKPFLHRQIAYERRLIRAAERARHERIFGSDLPSQSVESHSQPARSVREPPSNPQR